MMKFLGTFLILAGLMAIGGSAGDCDGKCMENANTLGEVMLYGFIGLMSFIMGSILVIGRE